MRALPRRLGKGALRSSLYAQALVVDTALGRNGSEACRHVFGESSTARPPIVAPVGPLRDLMRLDKGVMLPVVKQRLEEGRARAGGDPCAPGASSPCSRRDFAAWCVERRQRACCTLHGFPDVQADAVS